MTTGEAVTRAISVWDAAVEDFLDGGSSIPPMFKEWADSYTGRGKGTVEWNAMPEPFLGPLGPTTAGVYLALNPGHPHLDFQGRHGVFADEIRRYGSYSTWAASWPYMRDPWVSAKGRTRFPVVRLQFLRNWHDDPTLEPPSMAGFELFPWHSTSVTAPMRPPADVIRDFVIKPLVELKAPVFAFGAPWFRLLERELGFVPLARLGLGGHDYGSEVRSRAVHLYRDEETGLTVVAERHSGGAGPPRRDEVHRMRDALSPWL